MTIKPDIRGDNRTEGRGTIDQTWTPNALARLSQALLTANTLDDVLDAGLEIIIPTDVNGVTILLSGGPSDDQHLEIVAAWQQDSKPTFSVGTRLNIHESLFHPLLTNGQAVVVNNLDAHEQISSYLRSELLQADIGSLVALPLGTGPDFFGTILIDRTGTQPFSPKTVQIYEAVAVLATGAIEKLWFIQKTQQSLTKTLALYEMSRHLSEAQSIKDILHTILDSKLFGAAGGTIAILESTTSAPDSTEQELVFCAAAGAGAGNILGMRMPVSEGVVGWVVRENEPALVPDAYADERFYRQVDQEIAFRTHSILCAPLRVEGRVIGALELVDAHEEYLNEEGLRLLDQVAQQVAPLVENQRLLAETQRHAHDLTRLLEIGRELASTLDSEQALSLITSRVLDLVGADGCHVFLLQPATDGPDLLVPVASSSDFAEQILGTSLKVGEGITGRVALTGVGEIVNRVDLDPKGFQVPGTPNKPENLICVPLTSEGRVGGVMTVSRLGEEGFIEQDLRIVSALAGYAANVLDNSRLFKKAQQRSEELAVLNAVASTVSQSLTLDEILDATLEQITEIMPNSASLICLSDLATDELQLATHRNLPRSLVQSLRRKGMRGTLCEVTANEGQTYSVPDVTDDLPVDTSGLVKVGLRAYLGTPLIGRGQVLGTVSVFNTEPNAFTSADASLLTAIGQQVGIAVRNAQIYKQMERALSESTELYAASREIANTLEPQNVLQIIVNRMTEYVGADQCRVAVFDETLGYGQIKAEYRPTPGVEDIRFPMEGNPSYEVLRDTGQPVAIRDVCDHPITAQVSDTLTAYGVKSMLLIPLIVQGRLMGSVGLDATQDYRTFTESEINYCRTLADLAALALENRELFARTQEALQETTMLYEASRALSQTRTLEDVLHAIQTHLPISPLDQCLILLVESDSGAGLDQWSAEVRAMWDHEGDKSLLGMRFTAQELPILSQTGETEVLSVDDLDDAPDLDIQSIATLQSLNVKSALFVPLATGGKSLGWLSLITHHQTHLFHPDQIRPFRILADQAAAAIQNQQLLQQVQASLEEVEMVHRHYLHEEWTSFLQSQEAQHKALTYDQGTLVPAPDLWHPLIKEAIDRRAPVTQPGDCQTHSDGGPPEPTSQEDTPAKLADSGDDKDPAAQIGASLVAPLQVRGQIIGALGLEDTEQTREWTADELGMIQEIADQVALAIENARLLDTTQTSLAETERLYQTTGRLSEAESADDVIQTLAEEIHTSLGPTFSVNILRAGPDPSDRIEWMEVSAHWNPIQEAFPLGTRLAVSDYPTLGRFVGQKGPAIIQDTEIPPTDEGTQALMREGNIRTFTAVPLVTGERWLGAINVISQERYTPDERTLRFLQNVADRAAVALETMRLYEETQRRAIQLEAATKVSRAATSILEREKLLSSVVELIRDHFDYYHAQVFLVDPTERWAVLEASTGEIGEKLLQRGHALEVGGSSLIGAVTSTGEPRKAQDVGLDPTHFINPDLPETRSEIAIPLNIGSRVIGALDVQSTESNAFGPDEVAVLSTLADQLATAIENARLYEEQLKTAEKLREVDKLKTQFMASMSHELRTPLNSIIGFSRVILKGIDGPLTEMQEQDLSAIYNSGKHLLGLINNILDLSKIEAGKMDLVFEETDLEEIIRGMMSTAVALFKDKPQVKVTHYTAPGLPRIIADSTRVRQILLNLMSNAAKFTHEGHVHLEATYDERYVTFKVSDTGIGIPVDKFDVIFREFEQVDSSTTRAYGGTGLGLPISKRFVEMHNGRIWVESEIGAGSTFSVQLPIKGPEAGEEPEEELVSDPSRHLILSIDDDESVIKLYKRYLEQQSYQVIGLSEGENVVQRAREMRPHAILLDLLMPGKDGWTVIRELKADPETQNIPVIICSIVSDTGHGFSLGAADYLVKPVLEDQLLAALSRLDDQIDSEQGELKRVLIIDDAPEDRHLLLRALESAGAVYQILEAKDGVEGIEIIQQQKPDLVVLDLMMPEMDGFAVLETLKGDKETRQIPIIIVTAKELDEQEQGQINGQVAALFQKGLFNEAELLQDVDQALRRVRKRVQDEEQS